MEEKGIFIAIAIGLLGIILIGIQIWEEVKTPDPIPATYSWVEFLKKDDVKIEGSSEIIFKRL